LRSVEAWSPSEADGEEIHVPAELASASSIAIWIHCSKRGGVFASGSRMMTRAAPLPSLSTEVELNFIQAAPGMASTASVSFLTLPSLAPSTSAGGTSMRSPVPLDAERKILSASFRYSSSVIDSPIWLSVLRPVGRRVSGGAVVLMQLYCRRPNALIMGVMTGPLSHVQLQALSTGFLPGPVPRASFA
jgi:hypothetical protein